jgi:hypothetical protein
MLFNNAGYSSCRFSYVNACNYRSGKRGVWGYCCWQAAISCIRLFCVGWLRLTEVINFIGKITIR